MAKYIIFLIIICGILLVIITAYYIINCGGILCLKKFLMTLKQQRKFSNKIYPDEIN